MSYLETPVLDPLNMHLPCMDFIVLDIVSRNKSDDIVEVGMVKFDNGLDYDDFSMLVKPKDYADAIGSVQETDKYCLDITYGELKDVIPLADIAKDFYRFISGYPVLVFDAEYVIGALESNGIYIGEQAPRIFDILTIAKLRAKGVHDYRLNSLLRHYRLRLTNHRALQDCYAQEYLYRRLFGQLTIAEEKAKK